MSQWNEPVGFSVFGFWFFFPVNFFQFLVFGFQLSYQPVG